MMSARFRKHTKRAAKSLRSKRLISQLCEVGFHLEVLSFQLVAYIGQLQEEIHHTVQKGCKITSQQKGDFATLCKNAFFSLESLTCSGCNFFVSTPNYAPFEALDCWLPELKWHIACINWTLESAPKVADTTVIKNMLHGRFSFFLSLHSWFTHGKGLPSFAQDST